MTLGPIDNGMEGGVTAAFDALDVVEPLAAIGLLLALVALAAALVVAGVHGPGRRRH